MALSRLRAFPLILGFLGGIAAATLPGFPSLAIPAAEASVSREIPLPFLARKASRIVVGTAAESHSVWELDDGGARRIVTYHRVRVERQVSGASASEVWVRLLGGTVETIGQRVEGEASLRPGLQALLFLSERRDGTFGVLGMAQGLYPMQAGSDGVARLGRPRFMGILVRGQATQAAHAILPGKAIDDAVRLIQEARQADDR